MGLTNGRPLPNPWMELPSRAPYVLSSDRPFVEAFNKHADEAKRLDLNLLPEPFIGNRSAPLVVLGLNPRWSEQNSENYSTPARPHAILANLRDEPEGQVHYALEPRVRQHTRGRVVAQERPTARPCRPATRTLGPFGALGRVSRISLTVLRADPHHPPVPVVRLLARGTSDRPGCHGRDDEGQAGMGGRRAGVDELYARRRPEDPEVGSNQPRQLWEPRLGDDPRGPRLRARVV